LRNRCCPDSEKCSVILRSVATKDLRLFFVGWFSESGLHNSLLKGHGFSRAAQVRTIGGTLVPEEVSSSHQAIGFNEVQITYEGSFHVVFAGFGIK
jgi:hypothetical protein